MMSSQPSLTAEPRWATERTDRESYGPALEKVAKALGIRLMPWQRLITGVALEHVGGRLAYRNTVISVPRQQGKSTLLLAVAVWRMLAKPRQRVVFTAQHRLAASLMLFEEWGPTIAASRLAGRFELHRATGREGITASNGSRLAVLSTEPTAGHGQVVDLALCDECWATADERLEQALRPAMSTRANGQMWLASTAGVPGRSGWWRSKLDAAEMCAATMRDGTAGFEWAADADADPTAPETWRRCMPALGLTVAEETIAADMQSMKLSEFRRAYLNTWVDPGGEGWNVIPRDIWEAARDD